MLEGIEVITHSSVRINKGKIIYIDPYGIDKNYNDADIIFITHSHYDHYSEEDIKKVRTDKTIYVAPRDVAEKILEDGIDINKIIIANSNDTSIQNIKNIYFEVVPAYNTNKKFHPKENGWVGYILIIDGVRYYIAGDTDITDENKRIKCDVAFVPVGGTYTMTCDEAAELVNIIKPKIAVPIHYGSVVGTKEDADIFMKLLNQNIIGKKLMK